MPMTCAYGVQQVATEQNSRFDVSKVGNRVVIDCTKAAFLTIQTETADAAISTAVLTVKVSNDPKQNVWRAHPDASTITAAGITRAIDVSGYAWACLEVTTAEASKFFEVFMVAKG